MSVSVRNNPTGLAVAGAERPRTQRKSQREFSRPAAIYATHDSLCTQSRFICPQLCALRLAPPRQHSACSLIPLVLAMRHPAAILGFVVALIVDTVKLLSLPAFAHVGKENPKVKPAVANCDAAFSVIRKGPIAAAPATRQHRFPSLIRKCVGHSVGGKPCRCTIASQASTALGNTCTQLPSLHASQLSAVALNVPSRAAMRSVLGSGYHCPAAKCFPDHGA